MLPRFTRGGAGKLRANHWNELVDTVRSGRTDIELLKSLLGLNAGDRLPLGPYEGEITARSGTTDATYDAITLWWPHFSVSGKTPINREFATASITYNAAAVGDRCLILMDEDQATFDIVVFETITVAECDATTANVDGLFLWQYFR